MRKLLIILLLTWLPAQITWAAVSVYCQHESALGAQRVAHPGHHEHQHAEAAAQPAPSAQAPEQASAAQQPSGGEHPDCPVCHVTAAVPSASDTMIAPNVRAASVSILRSASSAPPPALPERPNWAPA